VHNLMLPTRERGCAKERERETMARVKREIDTQRGYLCSGHTSERRDIVQYRVNTHSVTQAEHELTEITASPFRNVRQVLD
jgi:hypothetical protein